MNPICNISYQLHFCIEPQFCVSLSCSQVQQGGLIKRLHYVNLVFPNGGTRRPGGTANKNVIPFKNKNKIPFTFSNSPFIYAHGAIDLGEVFSSSEYPRFTAKNKIKPSSVQQNNNTMSNTGSLVK